MEVIRVSDMLNTMLMKTTDGEFLPFSITFVKCDLKRNTGGEKMTIANAVLEGGPTKGDKVRNPNHHRNYTRNIKMVGSDKIIKIHALLVTRFNDKQIIL